MPRQPGPASSYLPYRPTGPTGPTGPVRPSSAQSPLKPGQSSPSLSQRPTEGSPSLSSASAGVVSSDPMKAISGNRPASKPGSPGSSSKQIQNDAQTAAALVALQNAQAAVKNQQQQSGQQEKTDTSPARSLRRKK